MAWLLWPALLLWGISFGSLDVAMNAQAVTVEKLAGRPILSGMHAAFSFGGLVGAGLGSAAIAVGLPLTAQQAILGAVALAVFLPASRAFRPDSQAPGSPWFGGGGCRTTPSPGLESAGSLRGGCALRAAV